MVLMNDLLIYHLFHQQFVVVVVHQFHHLLYQMIVVHLLLLLLVHLLMMMLMVVVVLILLLLYLLLLLLMLLVYQIYLQHANKYIFDRFQVVLNPVTKKKKAKPLQFKTTVIFIFIIRPYGYQNSYKEILSIPIPSFSETIKNNGY